MQGSRYLKLQCAIRVTWLNTGFHDEILESNIAKCGVCATRWIRKIELMSFAGVIYHFFRDFRDRLGNHFILSSGHAWRQYLLRA